MRSMWLSCECCPDGDHPSTCALANLYLCIQLWQLLSSLSSNTGFGVSLIFILRDPNCWCGMESKMHWTEQGKKKKISQPNYILELVISDWNFSTAGITLFNKCCGVLKGKTWTELPCVWFFSIYCLCLLRLNIFECEVEGILVGEPGSDSWSQQAVEHQYTV